MPMVVLQLAEKNALDFYYNQPENLWFVEVNCVASISADLLPFCAQPAASPFRLATA